MAWKHTMHTHTHTQANIHAYMQRVYMDDEIRGWYWKKKRGTDRLIPVSYIYIIWHEDLWELQSCDPSTYSLQNKPGLDHPHI